MKVKKIMMFEDSFGNILGSFGAYENKLVKPAPVLSETDFEELIARLGPVIETAVRRVLYPRY